MNILDLTIDETKYIHETADLLYFRFREDWPNAWPFDALVNCFKNEKELFRLDALYALGGIADQRAVEFLVSALEDKNYVKRNAADALSLITKKSFIRVWGDIKEQNIDEWKEWWMKNKESYSLSR